MSSHLMALLAGINAKTEELKPVEKPPELPYLQELIGRIEAKKWHDEMLQKTLERLCQLSDELKFTRHTQNAETVNSSSP